MISRVMNTARTTAHISYARENEVHVLAEHVPCEDEDRRTRSATWMLAPTVTPIARSILSFRAKRTALKISAALPAKAGAGTRPRIAVSNPLTRPRD